MNRKNLTWALVGLTLSTTAAHAATVSLPLNAGLSGWQTGGDVSTQTGLTAVGLDLGTGTSVVLGTASASFEDDAGLAAGALNLSGQEPLAAGADLEAVLNQSAGVWGTEAYEGSALARTLTVQAGDTLQFQWRLATRTASADLASEADSAWLSVANASGGISLLSLAQLGSTALSANGAWLDSGWQNYTLTFAQGGQLTVGWAVVDQGSFTDSSLLAVRSVSLTSAVPEPEGVALALMGVAWLATRRRDRR